MSRTAQHVQPAAKRAAADGRYAGVVAVPITPCRAPGEIDPAALTRLCQILSERGCDGIFAVGSTGEMPLLDEDDRRELAAAARRGTSAETTLYVGITGRGLKQTIRYANNAAQDGADVGVVMVPDMFHFSQPEMAQYMRAVADVSPIPVALYHHVRMPTELAVDTVAQLAEHPNIVAIKDTSREADRCEALAAATRGSSFAVFQGREAFIHGSLRAGAAGCVAALAAVAPEWHLELYRAFVNGQDAEAAAWQERLLRLCELFRMPELDRSFSYFPYGLKCALRCRGWLAHVDPLMVGGGPDEAFEEKVNNLLRSIDLAAA